MVENRNIMIIPARQHGTTGVSENKPKMRVAAYCRVSTDSEEQASSYETQVEHYTNFILQNSQWELAGIYADDGISGTNTKKRDEFNRMINDCLQGKIHRVITKSISRFARNTLDCLKYIRILKEKNIPVYFEKENIDTMDSKGEVLLTIMASLAQQESQSLSQNVKLGLQYRYQQGHVQVNHNRFLGYTKDNDKKLVIVPEEAEVVKCIFLEYLQGKSLLQIARGLEGDNILTAANKSKWRAETLKKILQNEKYIGDALLQKTYTVDFLTKKRVKNDGIVPQYYVENNHEPIIPRDLYMRVQDEMERRGNLKSGDTNKKRMYSSKYALSGLVCCHKCGDIYRRVQWNNRGKRSIVWRCCTRVEQGPSECDAHTIYEADLHQAVITAVNNVFSKKDDFLQTLNNNIVKALSSDEDNINLKINQGLEELQKQLINRVSTGEGYDDIADEIDKLRLEKEKSLLKTAQRDNCNERIKDMMEFLEKEDNQVVAYDDVLVRRLIDKIVVYADRYCVAFQSEIEVVVEVDF